MKVIRRNEKEAPKKWSGRFTCCDCASVLDVEESDLKRFAGYSPRGGDAWNYAAFKCPCCEAWNSVTAPKSVLARLPESGIAPPSPPGQGKKVVMRKPNLFGEKIEEAWKLKKKLDEDDR